MNSREEELVNTLADLVNLIDAWINHFFKDHGIIWESIEDHPKALKHARALIEEYRFENET